MISRLFLLCLCTVLVNALNCKDAYAQFRAAYYAEDDASLDVLDNPGDEDFLKVFVDASYALSRANSAKFECHDEL